MHKTEHTHAKFMQLAIEQAKASIAAGQSPFGAVIIRDSQVIAATHNHVWACSDPSAHAEVECIRCAGKALGTIDFAGCVMYSSCEPCPMCASAIHWANLDAIYFGARIEDAQQAGFRELTIPIETMYELGKSRVKIHADCLREPCAALFTQWKAANGEAY